MTFFLVFDSLFYISWLVVIFCLLFLSVAFYKEFFIPYLKIKKSLDIIYKPIEEKNVFHISIVKEDIQRITVGRITSNIKTLCREISEKHLDFIFQQKATEFEENRRYKIKVKRSGPVLYKGVHDQYYSRMNKSENISLLDLLKRAAFFRISSSIVGKNRMVQYIELSLKANYLYYVDESQNTKIEGIKYTIQIEKINPPLIKEKKMKSRYYTFQTQELKEKTKNKENAKG